MIEIRETETYTKWFSRLKDERAKARINVRIYRLSRGNPGDVRPVGEGVSEIRVDHGPGYRVYFVRHGDVVVILLCGGEKATQAADIAMAKQMARDAKA